MLKQMVVRIPRDLHKSARMAALEDEIPLQELVARALAEHLQRRGGKR